MRVGRFGLNVSVRGALACAIATATCACAGGDTAPASPEAAFTSLRMALASGRPEALEASLGPASRAWLAARRDALGASGPPALSVSWVASANDIASVERTEASETSVVLVVSFHSGTVARVPMTRVDGRWVFELPLGSEGDSDG